jgi:putative IMPACT (imprinted ancient) family translation regulator
MYYIQRKDSRQLETVDEFETRKEARAMLAEYQMADPSASYYLSSRACKDWRDK